MSSTCGQGTGHTTGGNARRGQSLAAHHLTESPPDTHQTAWRLSAHLRGSAREALSVCGVLYSESAPNCTLQLRTFFCSNCRHNSRTSSFFVFEIIVLLKEPQLLSDSSFAAINRKFPLTRFAVGKFFQAFCPGISNLYSELFTVRERRKLRCIHRLIVTDW